MVSFKKPNIHPKFTKLTLSVLVLVAVSVALLALAGATYTHYQAQVDATNKQHKAELQAARNAGYAEGTKDRTHYVSMYELEKVGCKQGANLYASLTPAQKKLVKPENVPSCPAL